MCLASLGTNGHEGQFSKHQLVQLGQRQATCDNALRPLPRAGPTRLSVWPCPQHFPDFPLCILALIHIPPHSHVAFLLPPHKRPSGQSLCLPFAFTPVLKFSCAFYSEGSNSFFQSKFISSLISCLLPCFHQG